MRHGASGMALEDRPRVRAGADPEATDDRQIAGFHGAGITR